MDLLSRMQVGALWLIVGGTAQSGDFLRWIGPFVGLSMWLIVALEFFSKSKTKEGHCGHP
jgi:hypothetical protein